MRRKQTLIAVVAGLAAAVGTSQASHLSARAASPPGFGEPTPAGVFGNGFETDLRLDYSGNNQTVYESAPDSLSSSISTVERSLDGGQTF